jgi:hypothetical protein
MGRTRRQKRKEPGKPYINYLPTELLLSIFIQFWALDYGSHHIFPQVCRGWHALAQSTRIFWTKILCQTDLISQKMPSYITCSTPEALSKHLARIDGMLFELCFNWHQFDQDWVAVLRNDIHRCYKISTLRGKTQILPIISGIPLATRADSLLAELFMEITPNFGGSTVMNTWLHTLIYDNRCLTELYGFTQVWNPRP